MIIWFVIFFIILFVSLVLAYLSMKDYQEIPKLEKEYAIYLVKKPQFLTLQILKMITDLTRGKILGFEKLFKGKSNALVIFGPKKIFDERFSEILGLLELEDYTKLSGEIVAWEVGKRVSLELGGEDIFSNIPVFEDDEHFFWQVLFSGNWCQIRAVLILQKNERKKIILAHLENLGKGFLQVVPKPFTSSQILENYRQRIFVPSQAFKIKLEEVLKIIGLHHK